MVRVVQIIFRASSVELDVMLLKHLQSFAARCVVPTPAVWVRNNYGIKPLGLFLSVMQQAMDLLFLVSCGGVHLAAIPFDNHSAQFSHSLCDIGGLGAEAFTYLLLLGRTHPA